MPEDTGTLSAMSRPPEGAQHRNSVDDELRRLDRLLVIDEIGYLPGWPGRAA